ncbi:sensor histidine kinase [Natronoflexus pectinivorans]|uniref:histidine kinase n=1 Tax=Natronoflexus pectinivorans TaxID=682526 RepID=A0A4R2GLJ4_9BACT|nr:HAMP domain-containing sensor histidine kinase [Natronoflexus pectinivorans]TCO09188.1 signal transduction histidine kinase [Natronoflexus pectinivorans]
MKIRTKITVVFTAIVTVMLLLLVFLINTFSTRYTRKDFYNQLLDRAYVHAWIWLEKDELPPGEYDIIRRWELQELPEEIVRIYDLNHDPAFVKEEGDFYLSDDKLESILTEREHYFSIGNRQFAGIFYRDNQGDFLIIASAIDRHGSSQLYNMRMMSVLLLIASVLLSIVIGHHFAGRILAPLPKMVNRVNHISASNLHLRLEKGNGRDELSELAQTFNKMLQRLSDSFEIHSAFIANASHELRTPITTIIGESEVALLNNEMPEKYRDTIQIILNESHRLKNISDGLLDLAQVVFDKDKITFECVRLDEVLIFARQAYLDSYPDRKIEQIFEKMPEFPEALEINGSFLLLKMAIVNLLDNAFKFSNNQPVELILSFNNDQPVILVRDRGIGIAKSDIEKVTHPFYRAENARSYNGHGIGLALVEKIMILHRAKLQIESIPNEGTSVKCIF